jgi:hypothetical protein
LKEDAKKLNSYHFYYKLPQLPLGDTKRRLI